MQDMRKRNLRHRKVCPYCGSKTEPPHNSAENKQQKQLMKPLRTQTPKQLNGTETNKMRKQLNGTEDKQKRRNSLRYKNKQNTRNRQRNF